jgi:ABC-type nitrate/sulfonate/bicarbonate transport system permease component
MSAPVVGPDQAVLGSDQGMVRAPLARVPGQPTAFQRNQGWILGCVSVIAVLTIWQIATGVLQLVPGFILPAPSEIASRIGGLIVSPEFWHDMSVSGQEFALGFGIAITVGLLLGLFMGWFRPIQFLIDPFVNFLNSTPRIALAPLFIIWFGIGIWSKVAIVFFGAVFPILITTIAGVRNLDSSLLRAGKSFGANNYQLFTTVALPGAVPYILSGLRLGIAHALTGVVVGEFIAANAGVGLLMVRAAQRYDTATVFAGVVIVATLGLAFTALLGAAERRFQAWKPATT